MHDDAIDETELSLEAEEAMLRGAIHAAAAAGHAGKLGTLIQAQTTLRNAALRLESYVVLDKRKLVQPLEELVDYIKRICRTRKIKYASKATKARLRDAIDRAGNQPGEPLRASDKRTFQN